MTSRETKFALPRPITGGLPRQDGNFYFESHYDDELFELLTAKSIPFFKGRPSPFTGLVGAMILDDDGKVQVVQDGRRDGYALAD